MTQEQEKMLDELLDAESGLTAWEMDFLDSLDKQRQRNLTINQFNKLNDIWLKIFK